MTSGAGAVGAGGDVSHTAVGRGSRVEHVEVTNRVERSTVLGDVHQAGRDITITTVHHHGTPADAVQWPLLVGQLPNLAGYFQHRPEADALEAAPAGGGAAVLGQVVTGTGGVGKTRLAAHSAPPGRSPSDGGR